MEVVAHLMLVSAQAQPSPCPPRKRKSAVVVGTECRRVEAWWAVQARESMHLHATTPSMKKTTEKIKCWPLLSCCFLLLCFRWKWQSHIDAKNDEDACEERGDPGKIPRQHKSEHRT
jgi:hypothetical protein